MIDSTDNRYKVLRGSQLPQSKLTEDDVRLILAVVDERERIKQQLRQMTNAKLAEKFGVHVRTIDRVTACGGWAHVV